MGLFYIYSNKKPSELYDSITFARAFYKYIDPDEEYNLNNIEVQCETCILNNIWENLICMELLPKAIIIHNGTLFENKIKMKWDMGWNWVFENGYERAESLILSEVYSTASDAADGVKYFYNLVAKTKATEYLLLGSNFFK